MICIITILTSLYICIRIIERIEESRASNIILSVFGIVIIIAIILVLIFTILVIKDVIEHVIDCYNSIRLTLKVEREAKVEILETAYNVNFDVYEYRLLMPKGDTYILRINSKMMSKIESKYIFVRFTYQENVKGEHFYSNIKLIEY